MIEMLRRLITFLNPNISIFLVLLLVVAEGCVSTPQVSEFNGTWSYCSVSPHEPPLACLSETDVQQLHKLLLNLQSKKRSCE